LKREPGNWTEGQPWLVNAKVKQVIEEDFKYDYSKTITTAHIVIAANLLKRSN
jgi:hypothetical protein